MEKKKKEAKSNTRKKARSVDSDALALQASSDVLRGCPRPLKAQKERDVKEGRKKKKKKRKEKVEKSR